MKSNPLLAILLGMLTISALAFVILTFSFISASRQMRGLQLAAANVNNSQMVLSALLGDLVEYSKRNPAIDPLLEEIRAKPPRTNPPAAATKPATR